MVAMNLNSIEIIRVQQEAIEGLRARLERSENTCQHLYTSLKKAQEDNQRFRDEIPEHLFSDSPDIKDPSSETFTKVAPEGAVEKDVSGAQENDHVPQVSLSACPVNQDIPKPMDSSSDNTTTPLSDGAKQDQDSAGIDRHDVQERKQTNLGQEEIIGRLRKIDPKLEILLVGAELVFPNLDNLANCFFYKPTSKKPKKDKKKWETLTARCNELLVARDDGTFYPGTYIRNGRVTVLNTKDFKTLENPTKMEILRLTAGVSTHADIPESSMAQFLSGQFKVIKIPLTKVGANAKLASIVEPVDKRPKV